MADQLEEIKKTFIKNTIKELTALKKKLVEVESTASENINQTELAQEVFLLMHSITGTAPMVGIESIAALSGKMEMTFYKIRKGEKTYTRQLITQTLRKIDSMLAELHARAEKMAL
jgi:chemotaxis protein histidine kinase CheA